MSETAEWTEGACEDGAAILRDGEMISISKLLAHLNRAEELQTENARLRDALKRSEAFFSAMHIVLEPEDIHPHISMKVVIELRDACRSALASKE